MKEKFPEVSTIEQGYVLCNDLQIKPLRGRYSISDIFLALPHSITYNGHRGDLCISTVDIAYFSIDGDWNHVLVHYEPIPNGGDVFDAFIAMARWLKENNLITTYDKDSF